jgi:hypothetical protein
MFSWFQKNLGDASLAQENLQQLKQQFLQTYPDQSATHDKALFYRHQSEGRLHCEVIVYFSPATADLATAVAATTCNKPDFSNLGLLIGDQRSIIDYQGLA